MAALRTELDRRGIDQPLFWGNRNWDPYLTDVARRLDAEGFRRVVVLTTSAYPSYSSCRQYRENLYDAFAETTVSVDRIRHYADTEGFVTASVDATVAAVDTLGADVRPRLVFVTHSIPTAMAETAGPQPHSAEGGYVDWHRLVAAEVTRRVAAVRAVATDHDLVYCSRSGPPSQPWLEPDVNDRLTELAESGEQAVVAVPIGFVSDHMEVVFDLDTEAAATARDLGLPFARAATAGTHPAFVSGLVDLLDERAAVARGEQVSEPVVGGGLAREAELQVRRAVEVGPDVLQVLLEVPVRERHRPQSIARLPATAGARRLLGRRLSFGVSRPTRRSACRSTPTARWRRLARTPSGAPRSSRRPAPGR